MRKRLAMLVFAVVVLLASAPAVRTEAGTVDCSPQPIDGPGQQFNPIQSGLWTGTDVKVTGVYTTTGILVPEAGNSSCPEAQPSMSQTSALGTSQTTPSTSAPMPAPQPAQTTAGSYVAMGDSVAAGVGLPNPVQESADEINCGRTAGAYPYIVASARNMPVMNVACSGATLPDITRTSTGPFGAASQLDLAFKNGKPSIMTVTVGANDAHWSQFASDCFFDDCATQAETDQADALLVTLQKNLMNMFAAIQTKSGGNPPKVVVTGYYNPISLACTGLTNNITSDEVTWMTAEVNSLNQTIQGVVDANSSFARFVPIDFSGHDVCSGDSWVQGLGSPRPFHPTAHGQQVIAEDVLNAM